MNDFNDLLQPGSVLIDLGVASKKAVFAHMAATIAAANDVDPAGIADRLAAREQLGSTGFGNGTAIPHAKVGGLTRPVGAFARLASPINYQAVDGLPVDCVFMLVSPSGSGADHLMALARVSRRLRDAGFVAKLRGAGSKDALYALFTADGTRDAA